MPDLRREYVDLELVSARLGALEARSGLSAQAISQELGVPYRTLRSWVNGEVLTNQGNYERLAALFSARIGTEIRWETIVYGDAALFGGLIEPHAPTAFADLREELAALRVELLAEIGKAHAAPAFPTSQQQPHERGAEAGGT